MKKLLIKIVYKILSAPSTLKNIFYVKNISFKCNSGDNVVLSTTTKIFNHFSRDAIKIGSNTMCMGALLVFNAGSRITIGNWCFVGENTRIWAMGTIHIGDRVFISHGVNILDNNSHSTDANERHERFRELMLSGSHLKEEKVNHSDVFIEDDVFIGLNVIILKGVRIGHGAIIGAGSIVTRDVEPNSLYVAKY
jgi:acetyltransferase-like isoleucine patch superfamily enzyme